MSNCIQIHSGGTLEFKQKDFKPEFFELVTKAKTLKTPLLCDYNSSQEKRYLDMFYWFISINVEFGSENFTIFLGEGHSTHTFRDLEGTIQIINTYYTGNKKLSSLTCSEEGDGFSSIFYIDFTLG